MTVSVMNKQDSSDTKGEGGNRSGNTMVEVKVENEDDGVLVTDGVQKRKRLARSGSKSFEKHTRTIFSLEGQRNYYPGMMTGWNSGRINYEDQTLPEFRREKRSSIGTPVVKAKARTIAQKKSSSLEAQKNKPPELMSSRWNPHRFESAKKTLAELIMENGPSIEKPIPRAQLRSIARTKIGDTGLLDHLLKHISGTVTPNGTVRRCSDSEGFMHYWLESADLVQIKRVSGIPDSTWWKVKSEPQESPEPLREENEKLKSVIKEYESKLKLQDHADATEKLCKDLMIWRIKIDKKIDEITNFLTSTQGVQEELMAWKVDVDKKLVEVLNSLNNLQTNGSTSFSTTADIWESITQTTNLDDFTGNDFEPWDPVLDICSLPLNPSKSSVPNRIWWEDQALINVEMQKTDSCMTRGETGSSNQDKADLTAGSSMTACPRSDTDDLDILSQGTLKELVTWKAKTEQQLTEISTAVLALQGQSQPIWVFPRR